jgi:hypothetical protein
MNWVNKLFLNGNFISETDLRFRKPVHFDSELRLDYKIATTLTVSIKDFYLELSFGPFENWNYFLFIIEFFTV